MQTEVLLGVENIRMRDPAAGKLFKKTPVHGRGGIEPCVVQQQWGRKEDRITCYSSSSPAVGPVEGWGLWRLPLQHCAVLPSCLERLAGPGHPHVLPLLQRYEPAIEELAYSKKEEQY